MCLIGVDWVTPAEWTGYNKTSVFYQQKLQTERKHDAFVTALEHIAQSLRQGSSQDKLSSERSKSKSSNFNPPSCPEASPTSFALPIPATTYFDSTLVGSPAESSAVKLCEFVDLNADSLPDYVCSAVASTGSEYSILPVSCVYLNTGKGWSFQAK